MKSNYKIKSLNENQLKSNIEISNPIIINGFETKYFITSFGRVYKVLDDCIIRYIVPSIDKNGYYRASFKIKFNGKKKRVTIGLHRLVAMSFIPNPNELPEVNHIDGNKSNNYIWNLEWIDRSGNMLHAYE